MYDLSPAAVYAHESVLADPRYKARLDRVVAALSNEPEVTVFVDDDLPDMIERGGILRGRVAMGTLEEVPDPSLLFNTYRFDGRRAERMAWLRSRCGKLADGQLHMSLLGYGPFCWWIEEDLGRRICRPCWRVHFQNGCAHKCLYCSLGGLLVTMVNVEQYVEHFTRLIELNPWQETFLLEDDADVLCLEPELGCLGPIVEMFGRLRGKYLIIHTKSANVAWMDSLEHNGNTIFVWSISGPAQAERLEPVAGTMHERIEAARRAQDAGYTIRYKFKPIIPVRIWREDAAEAVEAIFRQTRPDLISLSVFMWMDVDEMKRRIDPALLDPDLLAAAEGATERMADEPCRPFPPEARAEVYEVYLREIRRHSAGTAVSLSTESPVVWKLLGAKLGATPTSYVCGCGPNSTPWRKTLPCHPFQVAAGGPVGGFEQM